MLISSQFAYCMTVCIVFDRKLLFLVDLLVTKISEEDSRLNKWREGIVRVSVFLL